MSRPVRCSALGVLALSMSLLVTALGGAPAYAVDRDCGDFASQRAAQLFFLDHGGPDSDPHRLDADGDGIACESNPPPYYYGTTSPTPTSQPPVVVRSVVRLRVSRARAIAGEPLRFAVQVLPRMRRSVVLQRQRRDGGWARVLAGQTARTGQRSFRTRTRPATTRYRAVVPGTRSDGRRYSAARSSALRVLTQRQSVTLAMPPATTTTTAVTAVVAAAPVRARRPVVLQRSTPRGWVTVATGRESRRGRARFTVAVRSAGSYRYRALVSAYGGARAASSNWASLVVTPPPDTTAPPVPAGVTAVAGDGRVELHWLPVSAADLDGYLVYRATPFGGWARVARVDGTTALVTGLSNGSQYGFAVSSVDGSGNVSARSAVLWVTPVAPPDTTAPPAPSGVVAIPGDSEVSLAWAAADAADLAGYVVYRRDSAGGDWTRVGETLTLSTAVTVVGLVNGTPYDFTVTAVDAAGNESAMAVPVSTTPGELPVAP